MVYYFEFFTVKLLKLLYFSELSYPVRDKLRNNTEKIIYKVLNLDNDELMINEKCIFVNKEGKVRIANYIYLIQDSTEIFKPILILFLKSINSFYKLCEYLDESEQNEFQNCQIDTNDIFQIEKSYQFALNNVINQWNFKIEKYKNFKKSLKITYFKI